MARSHTICIAGAGIGGVTAALALLRDGHRVTLLEQAERIEPVGAGIQLSPNACKVLRKLGVLNAVRAVAFEPERIEMRSGRTGKPVLSIPLASVAQDRWGAPYLHVHRADLMRVLLDALPEGVLHLGQTVRKFQQQPTNVLVQTSTTALEADVLIGADGIRSTVQSTVFTGHPARFTGNVAWRAVVPMDRLGLLAPPPTACIWTGPGRHAVTYRLGNGLANFVGVVEQADWQEESWTQVGSRQQVLQDFAGFDPVVTTLIEQADTHYRWALFDRDPLPRWRQRHTVLLGDACHPMLPFVAQGAAQAMEDAALLAACLREHRQRTEALSMYEQLRKPRTSKIQAEARANMRRFHRADWAYLPVRMLAAVAPQYFHGRQDWMYGFDATRSPALAGKKNA